MQSKTKRIYVLGILFLILNACTTLSTTTYTPSFTHSAVLQTILTPTSELLITPTPIHSEETACNHPFFPLQVGKSWKETYNTGVSVTRKVIKVTGNSDSAYAELDNIGEYNNRGLTSYKCNQDGISPAIDKNTLYEGVFLPSPKLLKDEYSWRYSINYENAHLSYSFLCKVIGIKEVEWNNKIVDALRIECQVDHTNTENIHVEYFITSFFVDGIGEIMWNATEGGQMTVTEYNIP